MTLQKSGLFQIQLNSYALKFEMANEIIALFALVLRIEGEEH
jgi:hypothetical protein